MKKSFATGFICGGIICAAVTGFAVEYAVTVNPYPIKVDGVEKNIEGYNINDSTYFKLRDIADAVGGFDVGFEDDTILIANEGYVYPEEESIKKVNLDLGYVYSYLDENGKYTDSLNNEYSYKYSLPAFNINSNDANLLNEEIKDKFGQMAEEQLDIINGGDCSLITCNIGYCEYVCGDVLTVIVSANFDNDVVEYRTYSINTKNGKKVSNSELVAMTGTSEEDFIKWIKNLAGACYTEKYDVHASVDNELYKDRYDFTVSDEACNIDLPMYFDENGQLVVLAKIGSIAGASWYYSAIETGLMAK